MKKSVETQYPNPRAHNKICIADWAPKEEIIEDPKNKKGRKSLRGRATINIDSEQDAEDEMEIKIADLRKTPDEDPHAKEK
jgi:hypothetical protein